VRLAYCGGIRAVEGEFFRGAKAVRLLASDGRELAQGLCKTLSSEDMRQIMPPAADEVRRNWGCGDAVVHRDQAGAHLPSRLKQHGRQSTRLSWTPELVSSFDLMH